MPSAATLAVGLSPTRRAATTCPTELDASHECLVRSGLVSSGQSPELELALPTLPLGKALDGRRSASGAAYPLVNMAATVPCKAYGGGTGRSAWRLFPSRSVPSEPECRDAHAAAPVLLSGGAARGGVPWAATTVDC